MAKASSSKQNRSMSDDAVEKATGKNWAKWFAILDRAGARKMPHPEIARLIHSKHKCPGWWSQMVTVEYERARGLREKYQAPSGYRASRSATLAVPLGKLFEAWQDAAARKRWLKDSGFTVRKATPNRSMRITWVDGTTTVEVMFYPRGPKKSMVSIQHNKLSDAKAVARLKSYWGAQLGRLKGLLEN